MARELLRSIDNSICVATQFHEIGIFKPEDIEAYAQMSINGTHTEEEIEQLREKIGGIESQNLTIAVRGLVPNETVVLSILNNNTRDFNKCPIESLLKEIASKPPQDVVEVTIYETYVSRPRL